MCQCSIVITISWYIWYIGRSIILWLDKLVLKLRYLAYLWICVLYFVEQNWFKSMSYYTLTSSYWYMDWLFQCCPKHVGLCHFFPLCKPQEAPKTNRTLAKFFCWWRLLWLRNQLMCFIYFVRYWCDYSCFVVQFFACVFLVV